VLNSGDYSVVKEIDLSTSLQTARDIAIDKNGNLFMSQFGGGTPAIGGAIDFIPAANALNPATLTDNSSVDWYHTATGASFSGLDISFGPAVVAGVASDYNGNNVVDAADFTVWRDRLGQTFSLPNRNALNSGAISQSDYDFWKSKFGAGGPGSGSLSDAAVPEPASVALLVIGLAGLFAGRRSLG
jgi:PEP-CTERM motif-containing protein